MSEFSHIINGYDCQRDAGDCRFDSDIAGRVCRFIETQCTHVEGAMSGQPYILPEWQRDIVANLYGWIRPDATRRYREAFIYVPRKNSKTTLLAGLGLYGLTSDDESGAQVFSIAADRDQAALSHKIMSAMIQQNKKLNAVCKVFRAHKAIEFQKTNSIFRALSSEAGTKHGLGASMCIADEIHSMRDRELIDALQTGMGARRQPLFVSITTADYWQPESPCNQLLDYAKKVRDGIIKDQYFLPALWYAENTDDWKSEATWRKANPNYGLSVRPEFIAEQCKRAENEPSYLNEFKRLHLNITTDSRTAWIALDSFDKCVVDMDISSLAGKRCFAAIDLSATCDLTALVLYFPESGTFLSWAWIPEDRAREKLLKDRVPYSAWAQSKQIELTSGNVIDYEYIRAKILELSKLYKIEKIGYDPYNASHFVQRLSEQDRLPMIEFRQGFLSMNAPSKSFEAGIIGGKLRFNKNPVLRWNVSNAMIETDPAGNIKPTKKHSHSTGRIDVVVAAVMALGLAGANINSGQSVYETRGAIVI